MLLADLKSMAGGLGISGAGSMKKAQLVDAIKAQQRGGSRPEKPAQQDMARARTSRLRSRMLRARDRQAAPSRSASARLATQQPQGKAAAGAAGPGPA